MGNITYPSISSFVSAHASDDQQGQFSSFSHSRHSHSSHTFSSFILSSLHTFLLFDHLLHMYPTHFRFSLIHAMLIPLIFIIQPFTLFSSHTLLFSHSFILSLSYSSSLFSHLLCSHSTHSHYSFTELLVLLCAVHHMCTVFIISCLSVMPLSVTLASMYNWRVYFMLVSHVCYCPRVQALPRESSQAFAASATVSALRCSASFSTYFMLTLRKPTSK